MNRKRILPALLCLLAVLLCGCGVQGTYANADRYTAGDARITGAVDSLDIHWIDGSVKILYDEDNAVRLEETASRKLSADEKLHWWLDGTTLRVQYAASGSRFAFSMKKQLIVYLPAGTVLKDASVSATSGSIHANPLHAAQIRLKTTSGSIESYSGASSILAESTSGSIALTAAANQVTLNATSGNIHAVIEHAEELKINTTSGAVQADAREARDVRIHSTSGRVVLNQQTMPETIQLASTSGGAALAVPGDAGFTAEISTTSGRVDMALPAKKTGNRYVCGDGSAQVSIHSTSGNVSVAAFQP